MNPRPMSVLTLLIVLAALTGSCWGQLSLQRGSAGSGKSSKLPGIDICGKSPSLLGDKIINGRPAKLGAYPWMANIGYRSPGSTVTLWACAGSLITDLYVITAAHCIHPNLIQGLSVYTVRLGELNLDESVDDGASPVDVGIENTVMHPEFDNTKKINDIALVKLERRIAFTDLISPICLPPPEFMTNLFVGFSPIIAGWGKSTNKTVAPRDPRLLEAEIEIFDTEACRRNVTSVLRRVIIDDKVICAASVDNDSCQGDSGGPLMFPRKTREAPTSSPGNMFLMGVVSYGWYCAVPGYPGVYTRVSKHMSWIVDNLDI